MLSTHGIGTGSVQYQAELLRLMRVAAAHLASPDVSAIACMSPDHNAAEATSTGSSRYIALAVLFPTVSGSDLLSINNGFIPRGRLPKLNKARRALTLQVAHKQRATPPPTSLPCTAADVSRESFRIETATALFMLMWLNIWEIFFIIYVLASFFSRRPPVQKCAPTPCKITACE